MIKALKNKEDLALLVDQRDSSGPLINFFGSKAYTTDGFANLALKYKTMICLLILAFYRTSFCLTIFDGGRYKYTLFFFFGTIQYTDLFG